MNTDEIYAKILAAEYAPKTSRKIIALRKLDMRAKQPAVIFAYMLGITAVLIFGIGICLLTIYFITPESLQLCLGLLCFAVGLLAMSFNCQLFKKTLQKAKQRYAFEIVELAKEICEHDIYQ